MAETVKMCDLKGAIAAQVFEKLNGDNIRLRETNFGPIIMTDVEPKDLIYPEGWYYANGTFRNKHTSTTGIYDEVPMEKSDGEDWGSIATYCTRD